MADSSEPPIFYQDIFLALQKREIRYLVVGGVGGLILPVASGTDLIALKRISAWLAQANALIQGISAGSRSRKSHR